MNGTITSWNQYLPLFLGSNLSPPRPQSSLPHRKQVLPAASSTQHHEFLTQEAVALFHEPKAASGVEDHVGVPNPSNMEPVQWIPDHKAKLWTILQAKSSRWGGRHIWL